MFLVSRLRNDVGVEQQCVELKRFKTSSYDQIPKALQKELSLEVRIGEDISVCQCNNV